MYPTALPLSSTSYIPPPYSSSSSTTDTTILNSNNRVASLTSGGTTTTTTSSNTSTRTIPSTTTAILGPVPSSSSSSSFLYHPPYSHPLHPEQSLTSPASLQQKRREEPLTLLFRALRRFAVGFALNSSFTLVQHLIRLFDVRHRRKQREQGWKGLLKSLLLNRESTYLGAFMALYGLLYHLTRKVIRRHTNASKVVQAAIAGAAAGSSIHILSPALGSHLDPTALSLHALVRSIEVTGRQLHISTVIPHADALTFIGSCTLIMFVWFYHPESLSPAYAHWITAMADMDTRLLNLLRGLKDGTLKYGRQSNFLQEYCRSHNCALHEADFRSRDTMLPCHIIHPLDGENCWGNFSRRSIRGFLAAMTLYMPVHVLAQLLVHRQELMKIFFPDFRRSSSKKMNGNSSSRNSSSSMKPKGLEEEDGDEQRSTTTSLVSSSLTSSSSSSSSSPSAKYTRTQKLFYLLRLFTRASTAAVRSSTFLGLFIGLAWGGVCLSRRLGPFDRTEVRGPLLGSLLSGTSIFFEHPHRRAELATYVAPRALQSAWQRLEAKGYVRSVPGAHVSIFSIACALLMAGYEYARSQQKIAIRNEIILNATSKQQQQQYNEEIDHLTSNNGVVPYAHQEVPSSLLLRKIPDVDNDNEEEEDIRITTTTNTNGGDEMRTRITKENIDRNNTRERYTRSMNPLPTVSVVGSGSFSPLLVDTLTDENKHHNTAWFTTNESVHDHSLNTLDEWAVSAGLVSDHRNRGNSDATRSTIGTVSTAMGEIYNNYNNNYNNSAYNYTTRTNHYNDTNTTDTTGNPPDPSIDTSTVITTDIRNDNTKGNNNGNEIHPHHNNNNSPPPGTTVTFLSSSRPSSSISSIFASATTPNPLNQTLPSVGTIDTLQSNPTNTIDSHSSVPRSNEMNNNTKKNGNYDPTSTLTTTTATTDLSSPPLTITISAFKPRPRVASSFMSTPNILLPPNTMDSTTTIAKSILIGSTQGTTTNHNHSHHRTMVSSSSTGTVRIDNDHNNLDNNNDDDDDDNESQHILLPSSVILPSMSIHSVPSSSTTTVNNGLLTVTTSHFGHRTGDHDTIVVSGTSSSSSASSLPSSLISSSSTLAYLNRTFFPGYSPTVGLEYGGTSTNEKTNQRPHSTKLQFSPTLAAIIDLFIS